MAAVAQPIKVVAPPPRQVLVAQSTAELLRTPGREFLMLVGKDGAGKSASIVAIAAFVQQVLNPEATFFVIDTENKFPTALRSYGPDAPTNIEYYKTDTMNDVTDAIDIVMEKRKEGDWLAVESMSRIWERAQDMGYRAVSGFDKPTYLEKRRAQKSAGLNQAPVIPKPDDFWNVVKGAHDGAFLDLISQSTTLNAILSTTISKPPKGDSFIKENATRKEARAEFGMDAGIDGAPRIPYYVETLCILDVKAGKVSCRVVRDNCSTLEEPRVEFDVEGRKMFGFAFWTACRSL